MIKIRVLEAKNKLGELLTQVEQGREVLITRRGKPIAKLVPATAIFNRAKARTTALELLGESKSATLGGLSLKELIEAGRP
jgi:prevent-host-death family protein